MIQPALKEDVQEVLPLLLAAIGDIAYTLAGTEGLEEAKRILAGFYREEANRISYKHVLVDRRGDGIAGMLLSYGGDGAAALDLPFKARLAVDHGMPAEYDITVEAREGEYYLDSIAVDERYQGQGIAKALIAAFEQKGRETGYDKVSLIVEPSNIRAQALYRKMNYAEEGSIMVSGSLYIRMAKLVDSRL